MKKTIQIKKMELRGTILEMAIQLANDREKPSNDYKMALDNFYDKLTKLLNIKD